MIFNMLQSQLNLVQAAIFSPEIQKVNKIQYFGKVSL